MTAAEERAAVVKFLRERTNLLALADLIEWGGHNWNEEALKAYCAENKVSIK